MADPIEYPSPLGFRSPVQGFSEKEGLPIYNLKDLEKEFNKKPPEDATKEQLRKHQDDLVEMKNMRNEKELKRNPDPERGEFMPFRLKTNAKEPEKYISNEKQENRSPASEDNNLDQDHKNIEDSINLLEKLHSEGKISDKELPDYKNQIQQQILLLDEQKKS